jgi:hypothetical protein
MVKGTPKDDMVSSMPLLPIDTSRPGTRIETINDGEMKVISEKWKVWLINRRIHMIALLPGSIMDVKEYQQSSLRT